MKINSQFNDNSELNPDCVIVLTDDERYRIEELSNSLPFFSGQYGMDRIFTRIAVTKVHIPERLVTKLVEFRKISNDYGTLLFRNLPIDPFLPPTPKDGGRNGSGGKTFVSEKVHLLMMMHLGEPIAYADEKEGAIISNICPIAGEENKQENSGSVFFEFHTENAFHPLKPDYLGLLCLRSDHDRIAKTATASIRKVLHKLPGKLIPLLRQPLYKIRLASSFRKDGDAVLYSHLLPVLSGDISEPELCIDLHAMEAITPEARLALDALESELMQAAVGTVLLPGDLMLVDNRTAVHARTGFQPRYDGNDRWLQRLFVIEDFRRSRASRSPGGHVCVPLTVEFSGVQLS